MDAVELWLERRKSSPKPDDDFLIRLEELHIPVQHTAPVIRLEELHIPVQHTAPVPQPLKA